MRDKKEYNKSTEVLELNPNAIVLEGYNDCILGLCNTYDGVRVLYSERKIINKLMAQGMSEKNAFVYYDNELLGKYHGVYSPIFFMDLNLKEFMHES